MTCYPKFPYMIKCQLTLFLNISYFPPVLETEKLMVGSSRNKAKSCSIAVPTCPTYVILDQFLLPLCFCLKIGVILLNSVKLLGGLLKQYEASSGLFIS